MIQITLGRNHYEKVLRDVKGYDLGEALNILFRCYGHEKGGHIYAHRGYVTLPLIVRKGNITLAGPSIIHPFSLIRTEKDKEIVDEVEDQNQIYLSKNGAFFQNVYDNTDKVYLTKLGAILSQRIGSLEPVHEIAIRQAIGEKESVMIVPSNQQIAQFSKKTLENLILQDKQVEE